MSKKEVLKVPMSTTLVIAHTTVQISSFPPPVKKFDLPSEKPTSLPFLKNQGKLLRREDILVALWGQDDYFLGRSLDVFISRIRKYLSVDNTVVIENIPRIGFKMVVGG